MQRQHCRDCVHVQQALLASFFLCPEPCCNPLPPFFPAICCLVSSTRDEALVRSLPVHLVCAAPSPFPTPLHLRNRLCVLGCAHTLPSFYVFFLFVVGDRLFCFCVLLFKLSTCGSASILRLFVRFRGLELLCPVVVSVPSALQVSRFRFHQ